MSSKCKGFSPGWGQPPAPCLLLAFLFSLQWICKTKTPASQATSVIMHFAKLLFEFAFAMRPVEQACSTGIWCNLPECILPEPRETSALER